MREIRYDVAAIQLDLVVNRAGRHDPQARINVLASEAERLEGRRSGEAEPFFFRAQSGDCTEFRHTNRTPKDLELDDFQVKTPTDIIGQHIHLVKFDVTASDGSANGFNYEDGTLWSRMPWSSGSRPPAPLPARLRGWRHRPARPSKRRCRAGMPIPWSVVAAPIGRCAPSSPTPISRPRRSSSTAFIRPS